MATLSFHRNGADITTGSRQSVCCTVSEQALDKLVASMMKLCYCGHAGGRLVYTSRFV